MDLYMNLLDTFSYPLENTAHSCFVPMVLAKAASAGPAVSRLQVLGEAQLQADGTHPALPALFS